MKKKVRKPKDFDWGQINHYPLPFHCQILKLSVDELDLKAAKKTVAWLTKAILWLEQKERE